MDTARAVFGRLIIYAVVVFICGVALVPRVVHAMTSGDAQQQCQASLADFQATEGASWQEQSCIYMTDPSTDHPAYCFRYGLAGQGYPYVGGCADFTGGINPCSSLTSSSMDMVVTPGQPLPTQGGTWATDPVSGGKVWCPFTETWSGLATMDDYGHMHMHVTITYSGNEGTTSQTGDTGSSMYDDSSGNPVNPQPNTTPGDSPTICGGGSCFDPNANQFCGVGASGQFCIPGTTADSSSGGCISSGGSTLCAGSPSPPLPPAPPGSQITNPATQVSGSDTYQQMDPGTGAMSSTTITTYAGQGSKTSSGSTSSSLPANNAGPGAPASSSSSAGDGVSGGGSCTSPPACSGDAVECAVVQQTYATRCNAEQIHKDLAGTKDAPASGQHTESEVDAGTTDLGAKVGDLDTGGFGYSSACPFGKVGFSLAGTTAAVDLTVICEWQGWMAGFVLALASLKCAEILGGK